MKTPSTFIKALQCCNDSSPPIWLMRQAGRYMPQYRAYKQKYSLIELFHNPSLITEITLLPIQLLNVDAAILFSDILMALDGLGKKWHFSEGIGPIIENPLKDANDVAQLPSQSLSDFPAISEAIKNLKPLLNVPLIGFSGAPFTVASYLIEGGSSRDLKKTKQWMYRHPESFHQLLEKLTAILIELLNVQVNAGVDAIQIFDSWADHLALREFREFSLHYSKKLFQTISVPKIFFCKGSSFFASEIASINPNAISLDWQCELAQIRQRLPHIALQGNLDPMILYSDKKTIKLRAQALLASMHQDPGFIFNLGHGVLPDIPFENVKFLVDVVKHGA